MNQKHRSLAQCPKCNEKGIISNIKGLHTMSCSGTDKLVNTGICNTCGNIFRIKIIELVESKGEGADESKKID